MRLTFLGAAHEVTGSCFYLEACGKRVLIDCGLEQGPDEYENQDLPVPAPEIDLVLLTHAHIDHSGRLPLLYGRGFRGEIYTTGATADLCDIMLRDSAHIQMFEAEWRNRKAKRAGREEFVPLYTMDDAQGAISCLHPCEYGEILPLFDGMKVRFTDAGHLLGSASIEVWLEEDGVERKIVFSGDIGNINQPLIRDPQPIAQADYVVMESTYGDRLHQVPPDYAVELAKVIQRTFDRGGSVIVPSFAVGRTQELLYFLRVIKEKGLVTGHGNFPVYVDSPLAVEATQIFGENRMRYFDEEALDLVRRGINPIGFEGLSLSVTSDDSRAINEAKGCKVILSASGMCEAGRIKHHLKHHLWQPECTVLFVGYQANGTLGRALLEGAPSVKLFGEPIDVRAEICQLTGISAHADKAGLIGWLQNFEKKPRRVFVVHGESGVCDAFTRSLREELHVEAAAPYSGAVYDLENNTLVREGIRTPVHRAAAATKRSTEVFTRLLSAGARLMTVIQRNEGGANKDLARFADQINALCEKWDR